METVIRTQVLTYNGEERFVGVVEERHCKNGADVVLAFDYDKGEYRSFRADRITQRRDVA